jgi:Zn-finger nucleic acid-binding protein
MSAPDERNDDSVFEITCPHCGTVIWVDGENRSVLKAERAARKKESFDDLLTREKTKRDSMATKFEATASLEKQKKDKARDAFAKAFAGTGEEPPNKD